MVNVESDEVAERMPPDAVSEIAGFPFENFEQLQAAIAIRSFNIGVDPLAAAEWSDRSNSGFKKAAIAALSLLLVAASAASIVVAFLTGEYWLLLAPLIQALAFYLSQPASAIRRWTTVGGVASLAVFVDLLLNGLPIAATLVAYAGLTFACVRASSYLTNSSFRKALVSDEALFLSAYCNGTCTVRNNRTQQVYSG